MREELRAVGKRGRHAKFADGEAGEIQGSEKEVSVRKVIASEFVSLDGVMEDPSWTFQFGSEEQEKYKFDELVAAWKLRDRWKVDRREFCRGQLHTAPGPASLLSLRT